MVPGSILGQNIFLFQLMLSFLDKSQPTYVLHHGYSLARLFIQEFRPALFRGRSEICRILVFSLLTGFNSKISAIRQNSAATLYFMMKMNFNLTKRNFARSQLQIMGAIFRAEIDTDIFSEGFRSTLECIFVNLS